jgi:hypothetical protein
MVYNAELLVTLGPIKIRSSFANIPLVRAIINSLSLDSLGVDPLSADPPFPTASVVDLGLVDPLDPLGKVDPPFADPLSADPPFPTVEDPLAVFANVFDPEVGRGAESLGVDPLCAISSENAVTD